MSSAPLRSPVNREAVGDLRGWLQLALLLAEGLVVPAATAVTYIVALRLRGAEFIAQYALVLAWTAVFQGAANFGLPQYLLREAGKLGGAAGKLIVHALLLGGMATAAAMAAMICTVRLFGYPAPLEAALFVGALVMPPLMVSLACRSVFLAARRAFLILTIASVETALVICGSLYGIVSGRPVVWLVYSLVAGKAVNAVTSLLFVRRHARGYHQLDPDCFRALRGPLFAFALSDGLGFLTTRISVILLSKIGTLSALGVYASVSKLLELAWIVPAIFGQFLMPRIARSFQTRGDHDLGDFTHVLRLMYGIVVAASVGGALFAEPILALVFGSQAKGGGSILRWLMVYLVLDAMDMLQGIVLKCAGLQATDVRIYVSNLAGNVASALVLMPMFGGVGAAAARCLGVCCSLILRGVYVSRRLVRIPWLSLVGSPMVGSSVLAVALRPFLGSTRPFVLMAGYAVAAGILLVYWATRPQLGPRPGA